MFQLDLHITERNDFLGKTLENQPNNANTADWLKYIIGTQLTIFAAGKGSCRLEKTSHI